ncbi:MAG: hypothetical protein L6244_06480 [Candidatus Methanoperedenaceae archaeon]|nr:hypothetical protein [Euryarchaeota archaeon]MCG2728274.1 hypothetical protein [Candidatus Methanoperedenaceae archaeon]
MLDKKKYRRELITIDEKQFHVDNVQKLFGAIHEWIRLKSPQKSQRTQSRAITIFATFAFFAVRFLCYANWSKETNTIGN